MNISAKYWRHHKRRAMVLLGTIMVSTMTMTAGVFLARSASQGNVEKILNACGNYDLVTLPIEEEQLEKLAQHEHVAEYGIILNGGLCRTQYSKAVPFGAFDIGQAQEMFHYVPEKGGRYPAAPGEICGYRETFHTLSVAPVLGNHLTLELYDVQGTYVGEREYTIVGILNEADSDYGEIRSLENSFVAMDSAHDFSEGETDLPEIFFCSEDLPDVHTMTAMIRCTPDAVPSKKKECVANELAEQGIETWYQMPNRLGIMSIMAGVLALTENELYDRAYLSYNDFYSSILIPVFLGIVLLVSFISVYAVMADAMKERQRQFGLYRSMGMSIRKVRKRLLGEAFFFDAVGVALGYVLGLILYLFYLQICNVVSDTYVYSAFDVHPVARAISLSPYVWPWLLGFIFSSVALAVPVFFSTRLSPNEMLSPEKAAALSSRYEKYSPYGRILCKVTGKKLSGNRPVAFLIFITGWTFVFGAAFMMGKADSDNALLYEQLDVSESADADYVARKDIYDTMWGNVLFNRHNEGITAEDMEALAASEDVASIKGVIKLPGLKVFCDGSNLSEKQKDALSPLDIENNQQNEFLRELYDKSKAAQGYASDDLLYKVPGTAVDTDFLQSLSPYVRAGELDMKGLADGKKIVIVEYPDAELPNPFSVGDYVSFTDVVISDSYVEAWDFSHNMMPEGYGPAFYYDYTDKSAMDIEGYSFGTKVVFNAQVCAVLQIDDDNLKNMLDAESYVFNDTHSGYVSPGYEILCCTGALPTWGLPDQCYTDVYVNLTPDADVDRFEFLWYRIIGKSGKMDSISKMDVKQRIARTDRSNLILFASMIFLVIFTGCFGMINAYHFAVNRNMRNLQILRAVGISRKALVFSHIRELFLCPLCAIVTSLLPVIVFDLVKRYAYYYAFELGHNVSTLADNGTQIIHWTIRFPYYIELWKQPLPLIMTAAFLCLGLLNIAVAVVPLRQIQKANIVDGIRTDDF